MKLYPLFHSENLPRRSELSSFVSELSSMFDGESFLRRSESSSLFHGDSLFHRSRRVSSLQVGFVLVFDGKSRSRRSEPSSLFHSESLPRK